MPFLIIWYLLAGHISCSAEKQQNRIQKKNKKKKKKKKHETNIITSEPGLTFGYESVMVLFLNIISVPI